MDVITPTGRPVAVISTARQSAAARTNAPHAAEAGSRYLLSESMRILITWGATSPTNPIVPVKQTRVAVTRDTTAMVTRRTVLGLMPEETARFSSQERIFSLALSMDRRATPARVAHIRYGRVSQETLPRVPRPHM